jgi:hypothetical protein
VGFPMMYFAAATILGISIPVIFLMTRKSGRTLT